MTDLSSKTVSQIKGLGIYQITGGAIGVILLILVFADTPRITMLFATRYLFMLLFFGFSIYCGILCMRQSNDALKYSHINQILQLFGFGLFGFAFQYVAGVYLIVGFDLTDSFQLIFATGLSRLDMRFYNAAQRWEIDLNLVALGVIVFIDKINKQIKQDIANREISSMGRDVTVTG
jgi:hypothetical protein